MSDAPVISVDLVAPLHVRVTRQMWDDYFVIIMEDGQSEELEVEETRTWFKERGANMDTVDKALDHVWNFKEAQIVIKNPKPPPSARLPHAPNI